LLEQDGVIGRAGLQCTGRSHHVLVQQRRAIRGLRRMLLVARPGFPGRPAEVAWVCSANT